MQRYTYFLSVFHRNRSVISNEHNCCHAQCTAHANQTRSPQIYSGVWSAENRFRKNSLLWEKPIWITIYDLEQWTAEPIFFEYNTCSSLCILFQTWLKAIILRTKTDRL